MTGVTTSSYLTSEDPDLEDGEIASDEEGGEGKSPQPAQTQTKDNSRRSSQNNSKDKKDEDRHRSDQNDRRGRRSRPNQPSQDEPERKKKKVNEEGENSENEGDLLGVRGGSPEVDLNAPIWKPKATGHMDQPWSDDGEDRKRRHGNSPADRRGGNNFRANSREDRESRARIQAKRKIKPSRKGVADKEVCLSYLKGLCNKGAECFYSHNVCQPRKMELCKFYLKDCCTKRDRCIYLHEEFPCKFFHTGLTCYANKKCKFNHEPLTNLTRELLQKHSNPGQKENFGGFQPGNENNERIRDLMDCIDKGRDDDPNQSGRMNEQMDQSRRRRESEERDFKEDPDIFNQDNSWREDDHQKSINHQGQMEDLPNQRRGGSQEVNDHRHSSPANRRRDRSPDRRFGHNDRSPDVRFNRGNRNSPDNRFGRGPRGRNDRDDNNRRRGDQDDRRNRNDDRNNRNDDHGRNFGPRNFNDGPDNRDFNRNRNNSDGPGRGPHDNRDNYDSDSPRKRNFGQDGPIDNRNDNRHRNFGPDGQNMQNFGGNNNNNNMNFGPGGPNIPNFGQNDFNFCQNGPMNFGPNGPNFGPNGPNNFGLNNEPNFNNMNNQNFNGPNFMQNGPNFNQNIPNLMGNNVNFSGPNQSNFNNNRDFRNDGPDDRRFDNNNKRDQWLDDTDKHFDPKNRRRSDNSPRRNDRNDDQKEKDRNDRRDKNTRRGNNNDQGDNDRHKPKNLKPIVEDESNNSGTSSPFDFAKELAEYKNKKMEMDSMKNRQENREFKEPKPEVQPKMLPMPVDEIKEEAPAEFPPKFTQVYPEFPVQEPQKPKSEKEGGSKKHHHHKKKRKHSEGDDHEKSRKSRKEKKEKKRQPVIISEDGGFGGIKFKIKLNAGKEEKREVSSKRRHSEFMSSDDEIPLNCLQTKKDKEDGDETDTENRLVIETNEEQEELPPPKIEKDDTHYPKHLPKRQQELFRRIQSHQNENFAVEESSRRSGSQGERTPTPEPIDQNWYSSDEETAEKLQSEQNPIMAESATKLSEVSSKEPEEFERSTTPPGPPPVVAPKIELAALKDLSKINITELLSSIRQITGVKSQTSTESSPFDQPMPSSSRPEVEQKKDPRVRDPRMGGLSPPDSSASPKIDEPKNRRSSAEEKPPYAKSIYDLSAVPENKFIQDLDMRFQKDVDHRTTESHFGDVDLRMLGDGPLPPIKLGLPFKPAPMHLAATEIEASLASHPHIDYKVELIFIPPPDFSSIKISPSDPLVKRDPRLRRLFRVSSTDDQKQEEPKKQPSGPVDPRRKNAVPIADTPKSPPSTPFSPPQETPRLPPSILTLVQLGISAATAGAFDPRLRSLVPQDLEALRAAVAGLRPEDLEAVKALEKSQIPQIPTEPQRPPGLLPTPGIGLLPTPPSFMMNNIMDPMLGNMGPMGQPMPGSLMGPMPSLMNQPVVPFPFGEPSMNDADMRIFRGGFKGDRRGGRNNWRGNPRDRNWDNRRRDNWDERDRSRRDKDRRDHNSNSPPP